MATCPKLNLIKSHDQDGKLILTSEPYFGIQGKGDTWKEAQANLEKKLLEKCPVFTDEEFSREHRRLLDQLDDLHAEALRNPSQSKVDSLIHCLMVKVNQIAKPVLVYADKDNQPMFYNRYQEGIRGTDKSREEYNQHLKDFASRKYSWPCNVEVHKGLSDMTFPRSKENESGLERFLDGIGLASDLHGRQTGFNRNTGTSFRSAEGGLTFSGFVLNQIEGIQRDQRIALDNPSEDERPNDSKFPEWVRATVSLPELSGECVDEWAEVIISRIHGLDCHELDNHPELWPMLEKSFRSWSNGNSGGTFEAYFRSRLKKELRKISGRNP